MLKDLDYDIMETITILSKSIYRYDAYLLDAEKSKDESCRNMWTTFKANREKELSMLLSTLKDRIDTGIFELK